MELVEIAKEGERRGIDNARVLATLGGAALGGYVGGGVGRYAAGAGLAAAKKGSKPELEAMVRRAHSGKYTAEDVKLLRRAVAGHTGAKVAGALGGGYLGYSTS